jgi:hypothetical protein
MYVSNLWCQFNSVDCPNKYHLNASNFGRTQACR